MTTKTPIQTWVDKAPVCICSGGRCWGRPGYEWCGPQRRAHRALQEGGERLAALAADPDVAIGLAHAHSAEGPTAFYRAVSAWLLRETP